MTNPLVSVVIPARNAASTLAATLASVQEQDGVDCQVIVVDNGSTDATPDIAAGWRGGRGCLVEVVDCPEPGINHARNRGYASVRGDFVQWLDADDTLRPGKLRAQVEALVEDPDADIAYGDWIWRHEQDVPLSTQVLAALDSAYWSAAYGEDSWAAVPGEPRAAERLFRLEPCDDYLLRLLKDHWLPPHAYLLRRAAADKLAALGAWYPGRPIATDREYFTIAALIGLQFCYAPGPPAVYVTRQGGAQMTRTISPKQRAAAMAAINERLRYLAERLSPAHLRDVHHDWLSLSFDLHVLNPLGPGLAESGEATHDAVKLLRYMPPGITLETAAKRLATMHPDLPERYDRAMDMVLTLREKGRLVPSASLPAADSPQPAVVIVTDVPFWQPDRGDAARILAMIAWLAPLTDLRVFFLAPAKAGAPQVQTVRQVTPCGSVTMTVVSSPGENDPRQVLAHFLGQVRPHACLFEFLRLTPLATAVPAGIMRILDTHDLVAERNISFGAFDAPVARPMTREQEYEAFACYDAVILIQADDYATVARRLGEERCILAPHPVVLPRAIVRHQPIRVGFIASRYAPNIEGLRWFLREVWPRVNAPGVEFVVAGGVCDDFPEPLPSGVRLLGRVPDLADWYASLDVAVNLARFGAGLKIKSVEALVAGLPLVTTGEGARGISDGAGEAFLVADDPADFARMLEELLNRYETRLTVAEQAHRYGERFRPAACFSALFECLQTAAARDAGVGE